METLLSIYLLPGLVVGCVYGIASSGLVLTYSTSGVLNLAFGGIAYFIALIFYELSTLHGVLGTWPALVVCVLVIGPGIGVVLWNALFRWLAVMDVLPKLVATIGLAIALPALGLMVFRPGDIQYAPGVAPHGQTVQHAGPVVFNGDQLYAVIAAVVVSAALFGVLRCTTLGLKMRAVFDSAQVAALTGANPSRICNLTWALAGALAAIAGIFLAPILGLSGGVFLSLTVASIAAALVGGLRSIPIGFGAALLVGVGSSALTALDRSSELLSLGIQPSLPFLVMAVTLLVRRRPLAGGQAQRKGLESPTQLDSPLVALGKAVPMVAIIAVAGAFLNFDWLGVVGIGLAYGVIFLSFTIALGQGGLIPLGQAALVGIGGFVAGGLASAHGVPLLLAVLLGGVITAVVGAALALVGGRLGSLEFGLFTLAFGLFADNFLFNWSRLVPPLVGQSFGTPSVFGVEIFDEVQRYYMFALILGIVFVGVAWYRRRVGAFFANAGRMHPSLAASTGVNLYAVRVETFAVASFLAGVGGGLIGMYQLTLSPQNVTTATGLVWLAVVVVMGIRSPAAAVVAGLVFSVLSAVVSEYLPVSLGPLSTVAFGVAALGLAQDPGGLLSFHARMARDGLRLLRGSAGSLQEARS